MTQPTREIKIPVPEGYDRLSQVLFRALDQAATGKGKERHSSGEPFEDQPICVITRWVGIGGTLFQAIKKARESVRLLEIKGPEAAIFELLGAINFLAATVIVLEESKFKTTLVSTGVNKVIYDNVNFTTIPKTVGGASFCGLCTTMLDEKGCCPQHGYNTTILPQYGQ